MEPSPAVPAPVEDCPAPESGNMLARLGPERLARLRRVAGPKGMARGLRVGVDLFCSLAEGGFPLPEDRA